MKIPALTKNILLIFFDGGYNNIMNTNKVPPTQNTPALQATNPMIQIFFLNESCLDQIHSQIVEIFVSPVVFIGRNFYPSFPLALQFPFLFCSLPSILGNVGLPRATVLSSPSFSLVKQAEKLIAILQCLPSFSRSTPVMRLTFSLPVLCPITLNIQ